MPRHQDKQPLERKFRPFEVKEVDFDRSEFTGFSAGIGNRDLGNDIILPGAFEKTIRERVGARRVKFLDNHSSMSTRDVWGTVVEANEVPVDSPDPDGPTHKLFTRFEVSEADGAAQTALRKIAEKHLDQLSIGFRALSVDFEADEGAADDLAEDPRLAWALGVGTRFIKEIQWWETSVVIWAMNPEAEIITDSVTRLADFARKAAVAGADVPDHVVRDGIKALESLVRCGAVSDDDQAACVRAAVNEVGDALDGVMAAAARSPRDVDEMRAVLSEAKRAHEEGKFSVWVDAQLDEDGNSDLVLLEDDGTGIADGCGCDDDCGCGDAKAVDDDAADDGQMHEGEETAPESKDDDSDGAPDAEADDADDEWEVEAKEDEDADPEEQDGGAVTETGGDGTDPLVGAVGGLRESFDKLVDVLGAGDSPADPEAEADDAEADGEEAGEDSHAADEKEAARDADDGGDAEDDGRPEHTPDDTDALALEIERLTLLGTMYDLGEAGAADA